MMFLVWHRLTASKPLSANVWYGTHVNTFRVPIREFVTHSRCLPNRTALRGVSDLVMRTNCFGGVSNLDSDDKMAWKGVSDFVMRTNCFGKVSATLS